MTPRSWSSRRRYHDHATTHTSPATAIAAQTIVIRGELDSRLLDCYPCVQFGEIDADAAFTGTWTHVHRGPIFCLTQASLHPRLRPVTDRALVKRCRTFFGGPHGEPSWHRFKPRLERRYIAPATLMRLAAGAGREAQERIFIVHDGSYNHPYIWPSSR